MILRYTTLFALVALLFAGCKSDTITPTVVNEGISVSINNLPPNRAGETYAFWLEFPKTTIGTKQNSPQHGGTVNKLVTTFTVDTKGKILGFDTTNLRTRLGHSLAIAEHCVISIERIGAIIDTQPAAPFLVGEISGTATQGNSTLLIDNEDAIGYSFSNLTGKATFTSANKDTSSQLYLMDATSPTSRLPGISDTPPLTNKWAYALWAVDTVSGAPFYIYYGTFSSPSGFDSDSTNNEAHFPGGRYPNGAGIRKYDLRKTGKASVLVTVEPNFVGVTPTTPSPIVLLNGPVPITTGYYSPIPLANVTSLLPKATVTLSR